MAVPSVCAVCGLALECSWITGIDGDYVELADFVPLPMGVGGEPSGRLFFCAHHLAEARFLASLDTGEALERLRERHGPFPGARRVPELWIDGLGEAGRSDVLRLIRRTLGLGLLEARALLDALPARVWVDAGGEESPVIELRNGLESLGVRWRLEVC